MLRETIFFPPWNQTNITQQCLGSEAPIPEPKNLTDMYKLAEVLS